MTNGFPILMIKCPVCNGYGSTYEEALDGETEIECGECDETGYHVTDAGLELLAFLKRFKP